jgi:hypothetical protein
MSWASEIPFYAATYLSKAILLSMYFSIFPSFMGRRRRALWFTVTYCALAYIVTLSMQLFSCMPLERHWYVSQICCLTIDRLLTCYRVITRPITACDWKWQGIVFQVSWALSFLASLLRMSDLILNSTLLQRVTNIVFVSSYSTFYRDSRSRFDETGEDGTILCLIGRRS